MDNLTFWFGLFLSIPLAIFANIATPFFTKILEKWSRKKSFEKAKNIQKEYDQVINFHQNRSEFYEYLLSVIIKTTFLGAFLGIIAGATALINEAISFIYKNTPLTGPFIYKIPELTKFSLIMFSLMVSILMFQFCYEAVKMVNRVKNIEEYKAKVKEHLELH